MICDGKYCQKKIKKFLTVVNGRYLCRECLKMEDIKLIDGVNKRVKLCRHCHVQEATDCNENICTECYNRFKSNKCIRFIEDEKKSLLKKPNKPFEPNIPNKSHKPTAVVIWPFEGRNENELSLKKDQIVTIEEKITKDWWYVSFGEKRGYYPSSYLEEQQSFIE